MTLQGEDAAKKELKEMYSRFGWKWVALAYMAGRVLVCGRQLPKDFIRDLQLVRSELESGGYSLCDVASHLRDLEIRIFPVLLDIGEGEVQAMLELIGKAMNGTLVEKDVDLEGLKLALADTSIPDVCHD
jgi:hypothetical protein